MSEVKLKACPKRDCGGVESDGRVGVHIDAPLDFYFVRCDRCGMCGPITDGDEPLARRLWNELPREAEVDPAIRRVLAELCNAFPWWPGECQFKVKLEGGNLSYAEIEAAVIAAGMKVPS